MLSDLGHKQPPTPILTDNSTAYGIMYTIPLTNEDQNLLICDSIE